MKSRGEICKSCDAKGYPHPEYTDCKDNEIKWLKFHLEKAKDKIEFLQEIIGIEMNDR